jgi:hypothetical protein
MKIQKNGKIKFDPGEIEFVTEPIRYETSLDRERERYKDWGKRVKELYLNEYGQI